MLGKKVKSRILLFSLLFVIVFLIIFIALKLLKENIVYFYSPTEISQKSNIKLKKIIRIGGLVKIGSIKKELTSITFVITDLKNEIIVYHEGPTPNLFAENKGVVVEGKLKDKKYFIADAILAKHDENYMPPKIINDLND